MTVGYATCARESEENSLTMYADNCCRSLRSAGVECGVRILPRRHGLRHGGIIGPLASLAAGAFPEEKETVWHAIEPEAALRGVDVVNVHDLSSIRGPGLRGWVSLWAYALALARASRIVCTTEFIRKEIGQVFGQGVLQKTSIIHVPLSGGARQFRPPVRRRYDAMWVGSGIRRKGLPRFLRALLLSDVPLRVCIVWRAASANDGGETGLIGQLLKEVALRHELSLPSYPVAPAALDQLYRSSACVVSSSTYEGFHNVPFEGFQRGVPIVVPRCGPYPETYGQTPGVHYYALDENEFETERNLANAILEARHSPHFSPDSGIIHRYSYAGVGQELRDLYESLPSCNDRFVEHEESRWADRLRSGRLGTQLSLDGARGAPIAFAVTHATSPASRIQPSPFEQFSWEAA